MDKYIYITCEKCKKTWYEHINNNYYENKLILKMLNNLNKSKFTSDELLLVDRLKKDFTYINCR